MSRIRDNIIKLFNRIFRRNNFPMIANVSKQNYKEYKLLFDKNEKIESRIRVPSLEDKVNSYLTSLYMKSSTKTPEQIINDVLQSEEYGRVIINHPEINSLIKEWQEKTKHYTYEDKISY